MGGGQDPGPVDPTLDETLDALASWRRRFVLYHLVSGDGVTSVEDLSEAIVAHETADTDSTAVATLLHHRTLPKLEQAGIVEFDERSGAVRLVQEALPTDVFETIRAYECCE